MADNAIASNGGTPITFSTDDIGGVQVPRQKIMLGNNNIDAGTISDANPMPVASGVLDRILRALLAPLGYDKSLGRYRQTAIIESGTVTTVTTVSTVTGLTNIDGRNGSMLINANSRAAWALSHRARIT